MILNYLMNKVSPHVEIYKFPITALSSITNRATGLYLTGTFIGVGLSGLTNYNLLNFYENLDFVPKKFLDYSLLFCGSYHTFGGIRHIIWDKNPNLLTNISVHKSSQILFISTILSSILLDKIITNKRVK